MFQIPCHPIFVGIFLSAIFIQPAIVSAQPVAYRILPSDSYIPGISILVQIEVTGDPGSFTIVEIPPAGWTINRIWSGGVFGEGMITWKLNKSSESVILKYNIYPPCNTSGDAVFSGLIENQVIMGNTIMSGPEYPLPYNFTKPTTNPFININSWFFNIAPSVSEDELELYFCRGSLTSISRWSVLPTFDLYLASRTSKIDNWSVPDTLGSDVNSETADYDPDISMDGLSLYFSSDREGGYGGSDLWVVTRTTKNDPWGKPVNLGSPINSPRDEASPDISPDGQTLYFSRGDGRFDWDLYVTKRTNTGFGWSYPENLGSSVNSTSNEYSLSVSDDGLTLYFESDRPGGLGLTDIYVTTRVARDAPWSPPVNIGVINSSEDYEYSPCISSDGHTLYYAGWFYLYQVSVNPFVPTAVNHWFLFD